MSGKPRSIACWLLLIGLAAFTAFRPNLLPAQQAWEYDPYHVEVWIAGQLPPVETARERLYREVEQRCRQMEPSAWRVKVQAAPWRLSPDYGTLLERIAPPNAELLPAERRIDKLVLVWIEQGAAGAELAAREFDLRLGRGGPVLGQTDVAPAALATATADLAAGVFRPLVRVVAANEEATLVRARAGGLARRDSPTAIRAGELLEPYLVRNDPRRKSAGGAAEIGWSWLEAGALPAAGSESLDIACELHTGLRAPLATRGKSRVELLALALRARNSATELRLATGGEAATPLMGYEIRRAGAQEGKPGEVLGRTDWRGALELPAAESALEHLEVWHGERRLAGFPVVAGANAMLIARLPHDEQRLAARRYAANVEDRLVETVARRALLEREIRTALEAGEQERARKRFDEYRRLVDITQLSRELDQRAVALRSDDAVEQQQISNLFTDLKELARRHLDPQVDAALLRVMQGAD